MIFSILLIVAANFLGYAIFNAYIADIASDKGTALATMLAWSTATATTILVVAYYSLWKEQHNKKVISETAIDTLKKYDEILLLIYPTVHKLNIKKTGIDFALNYTIKNFDEVYDKAVHLTLEFDLKLSLLEYLTNDNYEHNYYLSLTHDFNIELSQNEELNKINKIDILIDRLIKISDDEDKVKSYLKKYIKA